MDTYEKKLALAKEALDSGSYDKETIEYIFPELFESEDEKIRKSIIAIINNYVDNSNTFKPKMIAWLEKQGEHANFRNKIQIGDKVTRNEDGVLVNLSQLKRVAKPADKVEPKFKVGDEIKTANEESLTITKIDEKGYWSENLFICGFDEECCWDLVEQKPAWSEEDERIYQSIMDDTVQENQLNDKQTNWLRDIKYRYFSQPKQEWSGWDRILQDSSISYLCNLRDTFETKGWDKEQIQKCISWLQSLRPHNVWKPSDEQMDMLAKVCSTLHLTSGENEIMESIYDALKKLKK